MQILSVQNLQSERLLGGFALQQLSFSQNKGEHLAIIGETGAGKSTLLKIIAGFIQPASGEIVFNGNKVMGPNFQLIPGEKGIAYLSQHFELRNNYRVEELLDMANKWSIAAAEKIEQLCDISHLVKRKTNELSGGEKQRVALAQQLLTKPQLLILDEPFSNLDQIHKLELKKVLKSIAAELEISIILSSHDPADILSWAHRVLVMRKGEIIQIDKTATVYFNPKDNYVAQLLGYGKALSEELKAKIQELVPNFNASYLRPEKVRLEEENGPIMAEIVSNEYLGTYYLVGLKWGKHDFFAFSFKFMTIGRTIFIKFEL